MDQRWIKYAVWFVALALAQGLIIKRMALGWMGFVYLEFLVYPLALFLVPIFISRNALLIGGFVLGLVVDLFYDSPGVHASASVLTAFMRPRILKMMEPGDGYERKSPTIRSLGLQWFSRYAAILIGSHVLIYYSMEIFNIWKTGEVIARAVWGLIWSWLGIMSIMLIFNPKE